MKENPREPKSPGTRSPSRHDHFKKTMEGIRNQRRYERKHPKPETPEAPAPST